MRNLLIDLCIWILRKSKVSVIIGMHIGTYSNRAFCRTINSSGHWYDCTLNNVRTLAEDFSDIEIPDGAVFHITRKKQI